MNIYYLTVAMGQKPVWLSWVLLIQGHLSTGLPTVNVLDKETEVQRVTFPKTHSQQVVSALLYHHVWASGITSWGRGDRSVHSFLGKGNNYSSWPLDGLKLWGLTVVLLRQKLAFPNYRLTLEIFLVWFQTTTVSISIKQITWISSFPSTCKSYLYIAVY